jgi:superfamily II DNA or RNA helicase
MDCNIYNQYYTDVVIDGKIINDRCFKGSRVYDKNFKINSYTDYKSGDYYNWINQSFKQYAFPDEKFNDPGYDPDAVYSSICNSSEYSLKPQQKFAGRIMNTHSRNRSLLVYHGLGSGKTQTSIVIGEAFKFRNSTDDAVIPGRTDALVLIVVPAALVEQYYSEIIGNIENGKIKSASGQILINGERQYYLDELTRGAISQAYLNIIELENKIKDSEGDIVEHERKIRQLKKDIVRRKNEERLNVQKVYQILSHETFLNRIFIYSDGDFKPGEYLPKLKVSNGLLIIDEIQNLVSAIGTSYRKLLYSLKFYADKNFRVVALTGTPIYDKPFEFGLLMNVLRPRIQFPDGYDEFNEVFLENRNTMKNKELFKKMCSGYVSYFKGGNPEAYPFKKTIIMEHSMNPYQYAVYKKALIAEVQRDLESRKADNQEFIVRVHTSESTNDEKATGIFNNSNLFCNIAFPEAKLTPEETRVMSRETVLKAGIREFKRVLKSVSDQSGGNFDTILNVVSGFSSKFAKVAKLIMLSPGPVFVYSNFVFYGVDSMATIMSFLGYSEYPDQSGPNGCYFVWKGKASPDEIIKAKQLFNSNQNIDGKLLRIMFGTQTVMEGVDFKNVRQVHILDPWWNDSRIQQIIARGIRLCSHRDLPSSERYVNVFIHLSTLGSAESMYQLKIRKKDPVGKEIESKVRSFLKLENPDETKSENWVFREAYVTPQGELKNSSATFLASDIVSNSIIKLADPTLTAAFGSHKNLDSITVQQYMYRLAMGKLNLNRQFESAIKEVSIDCSLNKNGNIVRLNEFYKPNSVEGLYDLEYENYSTGEFYIRLGLPTTFTMDEILSNVAMKSKSFRFRNTVTSEEITLNKSLILSENIICGNGDYSFENIPPKILNLTLNKELIPQLMRLPLSVIKQYFYDVQRKKVATADPNLAKAINLFLSKDSLVQKRELIKKLLEFGIGEESVWELYSLEELKKEYSRLKLK